MKKILIIDDDPQIQDLLQKKFRSAGFDVLAATDGVQGLLSIRTQQPDLVIFEVVLSGLDGLALLAEIRADKKLAAIPLIVMTENKEMQDPFLVREGLQGFFAKPFNVDAVLGKVLSLIGSHCRVLVVDDDQVFLKLMENLLANIAGKTTFCENGKQALEFLRTNEVDICFMDILMPVMSGIEAALIIRDEISKTLPIVAITSSNMKATKEKCFDVGMNDFIVKPPDIYLLSNAISLHVGKNNS